MDHRSQPRRAVVEDNTVCTTSEYNSLNSNDMARSAHLSTQGTRNALNDSVGEETGCSINGKSRPNKRRYTSRAEGKELPT